ncbi:hypothetical protein OESDEN_03437 [Oesophagostomum dentatum]|uniref:Uncharacterized protein n=1 Tax=Oesophagostomum dentatum TaxID=61180 RepID=A0A0B1TH82_OESDE|nr:hypothetical protein OESDEN_03437 [Oesophagostomum dentatum]
MAIQCVTYNAITGRLDATEKTCKKESDYCYNITADVLEYKKVPLKAGCSGKHGKCWMSRNTCSSLKLGKTKAKLCCCSDDTCNSKPAVSFLFFKDVNVFNCGTCRNGTLREFNSIFRVTALWLC